MTDESESPEAPVDPDLRLFIERAIVPALLEKFLREQRQEPSQATPPDDTTRKD